MTSEIVYYQECVPTNIKPLLTERDASMLFADEPKLHPVLALTGSGAVKLLRAGKTLVPWKGRAFTAKEHSERYESAWAAPKTAS